MINLIDEILYCFAVKLIIGGLMIVVRLLIRKIDSKIMAVRFKLNFIMIVRGNSLGSFDFFSGIILSTTFIIPFVT